ncbi:hypothetical protein [Parasitella parasitica]|uniref:Uncharacterized protein n=1 Tax=Parasitella parasitica TaxID=35722 RepID=A0A0B7NDR8_9FUNG|nr:hypothetical protein [Parasitella parasitica]
MSSAAANTQMNANTRPSSKPVDYGTIRSTAGSASSSNAAATNSTLHYALPGITRSITLSVYGFVFQKYFDRFVPINERNEFPQTVQTFFLDACIELWIRTTWVKAGKKVSFELMHYVTKFVRNVVRHDLRQALSNEKSVYYVVYASVKEELFFMLSRLALNWSRSDDYLLVVELWAIWAAPWRIGAEPHSLETEGYLPITHGWAPFILDNIPSYYSIVDTFLQRASTFEYKDLIQQAGPVPSITDTGSIRGQLRILYRLINVFKAQGLVDFMSHVERGLEIFHSDAVNIMAANANSPFKQISKLCHRTDAHDRHVQEKIHKIYKLLVELDGGGSGSVWKTKGLYGTEPRSENLLKSLNVLHNAALARQDASDLNKSRQLKGTYDLLADTFNITGTTHLLNLNNDTATTTTIPSAAANITVQHRKYQPKIVGLGEGGFLTLEEKLAIRDGKAVCSRDNIRAMGPRAETYVRSFEDPQLVRWSLQLDAELNNYYNRYVPIQHRPNFLPNKLPSTRATDSIIVSISGDMKLSNKAFKQNVGSKLSMLQAQKKPVGQALSLPDGQRHIFFSITRQKSYNAPSYSNLQVCLDELRGICEKQGILNLAIPKDLDADLQEKHIKEVLFNVFSGWPGKLVMFCAATDDRA